MSAVDPVGESMRASPAHASAGVTTINRLYNALVHAGLAPLPRVPSSVRYGLRTALLEFLIDKSEHLPPVRADVDQYLALFSGAGSGFRDTIGTRAGEIRWPLGRVFNGLFDCVDAYLYYCLLRARPPQTVVEIGSGNSAWIAKDAIVRNGRGRLLVIDPSPRMSLPRMAQWHRSKVEDVPLDLFQDLAPGDVLFIDSSHRIDEVAFHRDRVLPALHPGVLIHVHDFYFPYDSGYRADPRRFEETDMWLELLSRKPSHYQVLTCAPIVRYIDPNLLRELVPPYAKTPNRVPGSLWVEKTVR